MTIFQKGPYRINDKSNRHYIVEEMKGQIK